MTAPSHYNGAPFRGVRHIIGVVAGKGGVGKSTLTAQLARAYQHLGYRVGVLDADIYGPSQSILLPATQLPFVQEDGRVRPADSSGIRLMSAAFLPNWGALAVVRAPIANALIQQFVQDVEWGELDLLLVDFPPGTGDIPITLTQALPFSGLVACSQPQRLCTLEVMRALRHGRDAGIPLLGLVENMVGYRTPDGEWVDLFGSGEAHSLVQQFNIMSYLGLPFVPSLAGLSDRGGHCFEPGLDHPWRKPLESYARLLLRQIEANGEPSSVTTQWVKLDDGHLGFCTEPGLWRKIAVCDVIERCPCVRCRSGGFPRRGTKGTEVLVAVEPIGSYAVRLEVRNGCSHGIYPMAWLEELGEECVHNG